MDLHPIKQLREHYGLTQAEFAKRIGYARTTVSDVENMRKNPSPALLAAISRHFEITDEFVTFLRNTEKLNELVHNYTLP